MNKLLSLVLLIPFCTIAQMKHSMPGAMDSGGKKITSYNFPYIFPFASAVVELPALYSIPPHKVELHPAQVSHP